MVAVKTLIPTRWPSFQALAVSVCTWLWMMSSLTVAFIAQMVATPVLYLAGASPSTRSYWYGFILRLMTVMFIDAHPLWSLKLVKGERPLTWTAWLKGLREGRVGSTVDTRLPSRVVIMCNHVSDLDPFTTARALVPLEHKYIAKASLFSIPVGGWAMRMSGDVAVHFTSAKGGWGLKPGSVAVMFDQVKEVVVEQQLPILVFPEGTRDGSTVLKPFKKGMFDFAVQHRCHVLVMAIDGPQRCWPFPGPWFDSGEMRVAIGPLLPPTDSVEQLMESTRTHMQQLLDGMGAGAGAPAQGQKGDKAAASSKATPPPSSTATTIPSTSSSH